MKKQTTIVIIFILLILTFCSPKSKLEIIKNLYQQGIIGGLQYPSENIPADLYIVASNIKTSITYTNKEKISLPNFWTKIGYKICLSPGSYQIYSAVSIAPNRRSYYALKTKSISNDNTILHIPITIEVQTNQFRTNATLGEWFSH
jgi:hypothetical protein